MERCALQFVTCVLCLCNVVSRDMFVCVQVLRRITLIAWTRSTKIVNFTRWQSQLNLWRFSRSSKQFFTHLLRFFKRLFSVNSMRFVFFFVIYGFSNNLFSKRNNFAVKKIYKKKWEKSLIARKKVLSWEKKTYGREKKYGREK